MGSIVLPPYTPTNDFSSYNVPFRGIKKIVPSVNLYAIDGTSGRITILDSGLKTTVNTTANQLSLQGFKGWVATGTGNTPSASRTSFHFIADSEF
jgi:hypothetical protein